MELIKATQYQSNYHHFEFKLKTSGTESLFVCSDIHFDNPKCNRDKFFKDMDRAKKAGAYIVITGDFFCLMQGKYDRRRAKSAIRPEHNADNYLDLVINDAAEQLAPYADNILIITKGNHETSVSRNCETYILERLVERINTKKGSRIQVGAYRGYLTMRLDKHGRYHTIDIGYNHGNWGGIITKGTLSVVRNAAVMPDCDIMLTGHTHDGWIVTQPRFKKNIHKRTVEIKNQWHVKTGTYKEEFAEGSGWAVERIGMPKHIGGAWIDIVAPGKGSPEFEIKLI